MKYTIKKFFNQTFDKDNLCFYNDMSIKGSLFPASLDKSLSSSTKQTPVSQKDIVISGVESYTRSSAFDKFTAQLKTLGLNDEAIEAILVRTDKSDVGNAYGLQSAETRLDGVTSNYALSMAKKIVEQSNKKGVDPNEVILNSLSPDGGIDFTRAIESDSLLPIDREENYDAFITYLEDSGITPDNQNAITARIDKSEAQSGGKVALATAFSYMRTIVDKSQQKGLDVNNVIKQSRRPGAGIDFEKALSIVEKANARG